MPDSPLQHWIDLVQAAFAGRPWIVTADVLMPVHRMARTLMEYGATGIFGVAARVGTAPGEPPQGYEGVVLGVGGTGLMEGIRTAEAALRALPADVVARLDAFDPERRCRVVAPLWTQAEWTAGRRHLGGRPESWRALEDKSVIDAFWDAAGVARAPYRVVPATHAAMSTAAAELDEGAGTVWVADNARGFHGAARMLRWVRPGDEAEAAAFLGAQAHVARVMPFLDGVPCSIHGFVFDDATVALRPMEMMVLRRPGSSQLLYAKAASYWDPPAEDRAAMRAIAVRVGEHLRATVGYRGSFTVDGVLTERGFLPTELNPRHGAALSVMAAPTGLPSYLMHLLVADGYEADWRPHAFAKALVAAADAQRGGSASVFVDCPVAQEREAALVWDDGWRAAGDDEAPDLTAVLGPAAGGGIVLLKLDAARWPVGPPAAPRVAAALEWLDGAWGLELGPLEAAPEARVPADRA